MDAQYNELSAAGTLLDRFDLHGAVVAMDVPHTQADTATLIQRGWRDNEFTAKNNMPTLHRDLNALLWPADHREDHGPQHADDCRHSHKRDRQVPEGGAGMR